MLKLISIEKLKINIKYNRIFYNLGFNIFKISDLTLF